jgi:Transposase
MYDSTTTVTVGLDVHARSVRLAAVRADELLEERTLTYDEEAVERAVRRWPGVLCCYEAGPTGFGLHRFLVERGIDCQVVAPGLVPQRPGDRLKTDSRDARKLARLLAGGLLEPIHVPSRELEAARDLVRAREDARLDRMRDRHRLSKFCLRHGRPLPTSSWTVVRRKWLSEQRFEFAAQQQTFDTYQQRLHARWQRMAGRGKPQQKIVVACARELARLRLGDRNRSTTQTKLSNPSLGLEQRMRPTTRRTLEASMRRRPPVTRDARPRQLPTVTSHAVPTGECQSDPPSLPRTIRCSRPRANPTTRAGPLDSLLHVRGLM